MTIGARSASSARGGGAPLREADRLLDPAAGGLLRGLRKLASRRASSATAGRSEAVRPRVGVRGPQRPRRASGRQFAGAGGGGDDLTGENRVRERKRGLRPGSVFAALVGSVRTSRQDGLTAGVPPLQSGKRSAVRLGAQSHAPPARIRIPGESFPRNPDAARFPTPSARRRSGRIPPPRPCRASARIRDRPRFQAPPRPGPAPRPSARRAPREPCR